MIQFTLHLSIFSVKQILNLQLKGKTREYGNGITHVGRPLVYIKACVARIYG
jgi:hypothetical protein